MWAASRCPSAWSLRSVPLGARGGPLFGRPLRYGAAPLVRRFPRRTAMADAGKYGKIDLPVIHDPDEPVFVLRAKDAFAVLALSEYLAIVTDGLCDDIYCNEVNAQMTKFSEWQKSHYIKIPD
jgi:hypothetical protein